MDSLRFIRIQPGCYRTEVDGTTYFVVNKTAASEGEHIDNRCWWFYQLNAEVCSEARWTKREAIADLVGHIASLRTEESTDGECST